MAKGPEVTYRIGNCSASVFVNDVQGNGQKRKFRSVSVQRSYLEGNGDDATRKFTSSFGLNDLPAAIRVLQLALEHVEDKEAVVSD